MRFSLIALAQRLPLLLGVDRRRAGRGTRPIVLHQRRIFILPTGYGVLYGVMVGLMMVASANYNNNMGFVLAFALASLGMITIIHTYRNMAGLSLSAGRSSAVFCGETARFNMVVDNRSSQTRYSVYVQTMDEKSTITDVAADSSTTVQLVMPATRRGVLRLGTITIQTCFPLGLFRAWSYVQLDMQALVYPRPAAGSRPAPLKGARHGHRPGETAGTEDFLGLRAYAVGDSLRHVHWKALARDQDMMTKQFCDSEATAQWLDWDDLAGLDPEARLSQLCRWVVDADRAGQRYGLRIPGQMLETDAGSQHRAQCLQALALYGVKRG
jgi:uncharacterized protein (DUF58 family)